MANKNTFIKYAQKYLQKGQVDKAVKEYYRALETDPRDVRIRHKVGELLVRQGVKDEALKELGVVAESYAKTGFYLKAVAVYKQMIKLKTNLYDVHLKLGELYHQLSLASEAMEHYRLVADYFEADGTGKECLEVYKKIVDLNPDDIHNRLKLAEYHAREEETDEAIAVYEAVAAELREKNRLDELIRVYERLIQMTPDDLSKYKSLASLYLEAQDPRRALTKLQICFKSDPGDTETLSLLGDTFMNLGQVAKAKSVYKELARIYKYQGFPEKQREVYDRIRRFDPRDPEVIEALGLKKAQPAEPTAPPFRAETKAAPPAAAAKGPSAVVAPPPAQPKAAPARVAAQTHESTPAVAVAPPAMPVAVESDELHRIPTSVAKLMTETEVYLKYNLADKAISHLSMILEREPSCYAALEKLRELQAAGGKTKEAAKTSIQMSQLAAGAGDNLQAKADLERGTQLDPGNDEYRYALAALTQSMTRFSQPTSSHLPFKPSTEGQVSIEDEGDSISGVVSPFPLELEHLDEEELVDDSESLQSIYLTLTGMDIDIKPLDAQPEAKSPPAKDGPPEGQFASARSGKSTAKTSLALAPPVEDIDEAVAAVFTEPAAGPLEMVAPKDDLGAELAPALSDDGSKLVALDPEGGVPVFELDELIEDEDGEGGIDLVEELELELGLEKVPEDLSQEMDRVARAGELAKAYFQMHLYDDALKEIEKARGDEPLNYELQMLTGRCNIGRGGIDEAVRWFQKVLNRTDLSEEQELEALYHLGLAYEAQAEYRMALDLYEEIVSINEEFRQQDVQERIAEATSLLAPSSNAARTVP